MHEHEDAGLEGQRAVDLLPRTRPPVPVIAAAQRPGDAALLMRDVDRFELIVVDALGAPVTVLRAEDIAATPLDARTSMSLGQLCARWPVRHVLVPQHASASDALTRAVEAGAEYLLVIDPGADRANQLVGLIATEDVDRISMLRALRSRTRHETDAHEVALARLVRA